MNIWVQVGDRVFGNYDWPEYTIELRGPARRDEAIRMTFTNHEERPVYSKSWDQFSVPTTNPAGGFVLGRRGALALYRMLGEALAFRGAWEELPKSVLGDQGRYLPSPEGGLVANCVIRKPPPPPDLDALLRDLGPLGGGD